MKLTPADLEYAEFLADLKNRIADARVSAARTVNREMILLYWDIGRGIMEKQKALGWGKSVVESLSRDLQAEFSGVTGFSARNLWDMRRFYEAYAGPEYLTQLVRELSQLEGGSILRQLVAELRNTKKTSSLKQSIPETADIV